MFDRMRGALVCAALVFFSANAYGEFGRTSGKFNVAAGSARYSLPLWAPPGPNGLTPAMSLVYDSQAGNGSGGLGWNLSGLQAISRCPRTIHQDSTPATVDYSANDRFCINGNRLRLASGTYGAVGSVYHTEIADFSRITALLSPASTIYFLVETKDGLRFEYGYTPTSRATTGAGINAWWLNKVYDRSGNNYIVNYTSAGAGSPVPSSIQWTPTSHLASTYRYSMNFIWDMTRIDLDSTFGGSGNVILINRGLLKGVQVFSNGILIRNHVLTHTASPATGRSLLTDIKECADAAASNCFLPLTFSYQPGTTGLTLGAASPPAASSNGIIRGKYDFNGDGMEDLLYRSGSASWVAFGATNGFSGPHNTGITTVGTSVGKFLPTGRDAIATKVGTALWVYRWDDGAGAFVGHNTGVNLGTTAVGTAVDQNGDGLADLATLTSTGTALLIRLNTSTGSGNPSFASTATTTAVLPTGWRYSGFYQYSGMGLDVTDINGDGREDLNLVALWPGDFPPAEGNVAAVTVAASSSGYSVPSTSQWIFNPATSVSSVKFNGDSCTDRVIGTTVYISGCAGAWSDTKLLSSVPLQMLDWDGDGKTDFLVNNGGNFGVFKTTGNGFAFPMIATSISSAGTFFNPDLDGDGLDDLVRVNGTGAITYWTHTTSGQAPTTATNIPDLLSSVTDGFGITHSINYKSTAWGIHSNGAASNYPLQEAGPSIVVSSTNSSNGVGAAYDVGYTYGYARVHATRRTRIGFGQIKEVDSRNLLVKTTSFNLDFPVSGMVAYRALLQPNGVTLVSQTYIDNAYVWLDNSANNQRWFAYPSVITESRYEVGGTWNGNLLSTKTTSNSFDQASGTLYDQNVSVSEPISGANGVNAGGSWSSRTYMPQANFFNDSANWCLGRPGRVQRSANHSLSYGGTITRTTDTTWSGSSCRPTQTIEEPGSSTSQVVTDFGYDSFGNLTSTTVTGVGMTPRVTSTIYADATYTTGQFPLSSSNALSQSTSMGWNYDLGVPLNSTDPNGLTTSWLYDAWGRRTRETRPDGTATTWVINNCSAVAGGCVNSLNKSVVVETELTNIGGAIKDNWSYLDQLDREIVYRSRLMSGTYFRVDREYDALGRIYRESAPCDWSSCTQHWTSNSYDLLGRPTVVTRPTADTGMQSSYFHYEGLSLRAVDALSKQATKISTAAGALSRFIDHDGYYQSFDYDGFGAPKRVMDSSGNVLQSSTYNVRGFLTARSDMDMGSWSFTPNALGEVISQTDAKGQTTGFAYDGLGRLTSRTEAEGTSTWTWGISSAAKNIGQLSSLSGPDGYGETFTYTAVGKPVSRVISAGGTTFQYNYGYNELGKLDNMTYPTSTSGYRLKLRFDYQRGELYRIRDFNALTTVFWLANGNDFRNEVTQETLNNGLVTNRSFDPGTGWLKTIKTGVGGGTGVQDLAYTWDAVGNLKTRQDVNQASLTEQFYYDNLHRLDYSQLNGVTNLDMGYDALGNITSKSDVGSYSYHPVKRHQVASTSNGWNFAYDNNGNMTSGRGISIDWTSYNYPSCTRIAASCSGGGD